MRTTDRPEALAAQIRQDADRNPEPCGRPWTHDPHGDCPGH